jgi:acyl-coenzyme A synthetase/AMP-(fatty) acid ligase
VSQAAGVGFDASAWEVWPALSAGCVVRVVPAAVRPDPDALATWLVDNGIEFAFVPTPVAEMLVRRQWPDQCRIKVLGVGGDRLHPLPEHLPFQVLNLYGPTECTVVTAAHRVEPGGARLPPIGSVVPFGYGRVVDASGALVNPGHEGELWIGGSGVAAGYLGDEQATRSRFIPDPYSPLGGVVYRSGDIVRRRPDGTLDFVGRKDRQFKISGVRIELGEVEATALRLVGVRQAVATATGEHGRQRLSLFLVGEPSVDQQKTEQRIRAGLPTQLRHLTIRFVPKLPLNGNGKVDPRMLPEIHTHRPPSASVVELARQCAGSDDLGAAWFQLGASSLDAARLVSRLGQELGITATLRSLLEAESVDAYLATLNGGRTQAAAPPESARVAHPPPHADDLSALTVLWPALERLSAQAKLDLAQRLISAARGDIAP